MAIQGLRNTTSFDSPTGRRPENFREAILMLYPNGGGIEKAPLTALTAVMKSEAVDDPVFHWFTKSLQDRRLKLAASLNNTDVAGAIVSVTVDSAYNGAFSVKEGDLLMVEQTNEILYVNTTPSASNTVSVIRGFDLAAGSALSAVAYNGAGINPFIVVIGSAFEEGSAAPDPVSFDPVEVFNQCQIFRGTYGLTNTAREVRTRTGSEETELKREALENFGIDMERGFFFGKKTTTIRNGQPLRTTNGVLSFIPAANRFTPANDGAFTFEEFEAWSLDIFRYGSTEKMAFCGNTFLSAVSQMVRKNGEGHYELGSEVKEYGIGGIRRLRTPHGALVLKPHPLFTQMVGGTNAGSQFTSMDNAAVVLDMRNIRYRFLKNRDVKFQDNLQLPGVDAKLAGWIGECGLEVHHPYTHAFISGVKSGAKDA
jgi:hypothetical protein